MQAKNNKSCNGAIEVIEGINVTPDEARAIIFRMKQQLKNSDWKSTPVPRSHVNIAKQMFDSAENESVYTVRIEDEHSLQEIKEALNVESRSIVPVIGALMEFHKNNESLNIIISDTVMDHSAYARYTNQFAQQIAKTTQEFLKVRCFHDPKGEVMGVFCRKTETDISVTFKGQLVAALQSTGEATFKITDIPGTYVDYPSMLLYTIRKKFPDNEIILKKMKNSFKFTKK